MHLGMHHNQVVRTTNEVCEEEIDQAELLVTASSKVRVK
jgi:hypothetical protein